MKRPHIPYLLPAACLVLSGAGILSMSGYERLATQGTSVAGRDTMIMGGKSVKGGRGKRLQHLNAGLQRTAPLLKPKGNANVKNAARAPKRLLTPDPRGNLLAGVVSFQGIQSYDQGYWGSINLTDGTITPIYSGPQFGAGQDYDIQTGAVRDGILYTPVVNEDLFGYSIEWRRTDLSDGRQLPSISFGEDWAAYAYSMTYDPDSDLFHILGLDLATQGYGIYSTVDPETWNVETYGMLTTREFLGAIAYNPADGMVWTFSDSSRAYTVDAGSLIEMGDFDSDYELIHDGMTTAATYSPLDGSFVFLWLDFYTQSTRLAYLDPETLEIAEGVALAPSNPFVGYFYSPDQYAPNDAPALPAAARGSFKEDALTGTITFTAPAETYAATALSGPVTMTLTIDGKKECEVALQPGEEHTRELTLGHGLHRLELTAAAAGVSSPMSVSYLYTGNDNPRTPADLRLEGNNLSWTASGAVGEHGGFVAADEITYDVLVDGVKQNPAPVTATSFTLDTDRDLALAQIEVVANAREMASKPAVISEIIGNGLTLPWEMLPSDEQASMFRMVNANGDDSFFEFGFDYSRNHNIFELWLQYGDDGDDWLFLPKTFFPSVDNLYNVAFTYRNPAAYESSESLEVMIGDAADPKAMKKRLYSHEDKVTMEDELLVVPFAIEEPGEYVIGIHCTSKAPEGYGVDLFNFSMTSTDQSSAVPGDPSKVEIKAAPLGALSATLAITAPTKDMAGKALPADDKVVFEVECVGGGTASVSILPGETGTVDVKAGGNGTAFFRLTPSNSSGTGITRQHSAYVGIDRPRAPRSVVCQASEDNRSMTISWERPENVGENGGYVDVDNLQYVVYTQTGVTSNEIAVVPGNVRTYTFTPAETQQFTLYMGAAARNEAGESRFNPFIGDNIGTPYAVPMTEKFSTYGFGIEPLRSNLQGVYSNSAWESVSSLMGMGTGATSDFELGGLIVFNQVYAPGRAQLVLPKMTTSGSPATAFTLRWLDWLHTPVFSLWGRAYGDSQLVKLGEFAPERPAAGEWRESQVVLPERFNDCSWVEFCIEAELTGEMEEFGFIDAISVSQNVEYDFKLASLEAPATLMVGEKAQVLVTVINAGIEPQRGVLKVDVTDADGRVWQSDSWNMGRLAAEQKFMQYVEVEAVRELLDDETMVITAVVEASDGDEVPANDRMVSVVDIKPSQAPSVGTLQASWADDDHQSAYLSWQTPDLGYGDSDGFELLPPFAKSEKLGFWVNLDRDGGYPFRINGLEWANNNEPIAWQPIDALSLGVNDDPRIGAHTGKMYLMARSISYDESTGEEPQQSDDWLISPEIVGGTQLEFWYGTIDPDLPEFVRLMVSSTDRNPESFRYVRTFSKSGEESWENVRVTLPADAKYFALVYASYDSFGAMIDDISFTPAELQQWVVDHYNVLRSVGDAAETVIGRTESTEYTDNTLEGRSASYRVVTAVKTVDGFREGPASNRVTLVGSGIDDMRLLQGVSGGKGCIAFTGHAGEHAYLYGADGKYAGECYVPTDSYSAPFAPGVYMVKIGNSYAKILVK